MKLHVEAEGTKGMGLTIVKASHRDDEMFIATHTYRSATIPYGIDLFQEVNEYLATLPEENQAAIFTIYRQISDDLENMRGGYLESSVMNQVKALFDLADYQSLYNFTVRAGWQYPSNVSEKYEEYSQRGRNYRERTYIKQEYVELITLGLAMRLMIPIWGPYIAKTHGTTGTEFKEIVARQLLDRSEVVKWGPYIRLEEYIRSSVESKVPNASLSALSVGLSSEEIPEYLLSLALIRRVTMGILNVRNDDDSIVKNLFNFVNGTGGRMDTRFGVIRAKTARPGELEEDNSSVLDAWTTTQEISDGDKKFIETFTELVDVIVEKVDPTLSMPRVQACIAAVSKGNDRLVEPFQKALIVWVIRCISPEARDLIPIAGLLRLMGIAQAALEHWGYNELAILVSARRVTGEMSVQESRNRLTKVQIEALDEDYPFYRLPSTANRQQRRGNDASTAVDMIADWIAYDQYVPYAPASLINKIPYLSTTKSMSVPGDIRRQIVDMILHVNKLTREQVGVL